MNLRSALGALALTTFAASPLAASAQEYPAAPYGYQRVADADDAYHFHGERIEGRIVSVDGSDLRLRDGY
jgi:hypothetical protein